MHGLGSCRFQKQDSFAEFKSAIDLYLQIHSIFNSSSVRRNISTACHPKDMSFYHIYIILMALLRNENFASLTENIAAS
jgi:hypothetical protein